MNEPGAVEEFLGSAAVAVAGASDDPTKFGHRVYAALLRHGRTAYPVNPNAATVLGHRTYATLADLPEEVEALSIITPPRVTERLIDDAIAAGVKRVWMQPGAESAEAIRKAEAAGISVIAGGPCLLVDLPRMARGS